MENISFIRNCPSCNKELVYKTARTYNQATDKGSSCRKCTHKMWIRNNPNTSCGVCGKHIYRRPCRQKKIHFCTYGCRNKYYSQEKSFAWKGGTKASKKRNREKDRERRQEYKKRAVQLCGGKCIRCGYDKYIGALEFHHEDPKEKDFTIKSGISGGWDKIEREIKKCILLCATCHREEHHRIREDERRTN